MPVDLGLLAGEQVTLGRSSVTHQLFLGLMFISSERIV